MNITFENVNVDINDFKILKDINLSIKPHSFVGILGKNGAGKSTLLKCLYKYQKINSGNIYIDDKNIKDISSKTIAKNMAVVLQEIPVNFGMSVYDIVMMGRMPHKKLFSPISKEDINFVKYSLKKVDMQGFIDKPFSTLSGGEKQRVLIARALCQTPQILLLDEPTNHLDIKHQINTMHLIKQLNITTIAVVHDLNIAAAFCDYICVLKENTVYKFGTPQDILTPETLEDIFDIKANVSQCQKYNHPDINIQYMEK